MTTYTSRDGEVIENIRWRFYGRKAGAVEAVLAANPGLAGQGPVLPAVAEIHLPDLTRPLETIPTVKLWH